MSGFTVRTCGEEGCAGLVLSENRSSGNVDQGCSFIVVASLCRRGRNALCLFINGISFQDLFESRSATSSCRPAAHVSIEK